MALIPFVKPPIFPLAAVLKRPNPSAYSPRAAAQIVAVCGLECAWVAAIIPAASITSFEHRSEHDSLSGSSLGGSRFAQQPMRIIWTVPPAAPQTGGVQDQKIGTKMQKRSLPYRRICFSISKCSKCAPATRLTRSEFTSRCIKSFLIWLAKRTLPPPGGPCLARAANLGGVAARHYCMLCMQHVPHLI